MNNFLLSLPDSFFQMPSWMVGPISQGVGNGARVFEVGYGAQAPDKGDVLTCTLSEFLDLDEAEDERVQLQLKEEAVGRLTSVDEQGRTLLIRAVEERNELEVSKLVEESILYGVSLNALDRNKRTALMYAAMSDNETIVSELLRGFSKLNDDFFIRDKHGCSAIFYAANFANKKALSLLIKYARTLESPLGHVDKSGRTVLNCLSHGWDVTLYRELINAMRLNGGDFNVTDVHGMSALDWALHWENSAFVNELLKAGAAVSENQMSAVLKLMGCQGKASALVEAANKLHSGVVNALILHSDADEATLMRALRTMWPKAKATDRAAWMKVAAKDGCSNVVAWLAGQMARDPHEKDSEKARQKALNTAMLKAAKKGFSDVVADAIGLGAQYSAVNDKHKSVSTYAIEYGNMHLFLALHPGA